MAEKKKAHSQLFFYFIFFTHSPQSKMTKQGTITPQEFTIQACRVLP